MTPQVRGGPRTWEGRSSGVLGTEVPQWGLGATARLGSEGRSPSETGDLLQIILQLDAKPVEICRGASNYRMDLSR